MIAFSPSVSFQHSYEAKFGEDKRIETVTMRREALPGTHITGRYRIERLGVVAAHRWVETQIMYLCVSTDTITIKQTRVLTSQNG